MGVTACNDGQHRNNIQTTTFDAVNPYNGVKTKVVNMTDGYNTEYNSVPIDYNNKLLNATSLNDDDYSSTQDVIISDSESGYSNYNLWIRKGQSWVRQTGGKSQPASVSKTYGIVTPNFIVLQDANFDLWIYNGTVWSKQTTKIKNSPSQLLSYPPSVSHIYGIPSLNSIVLQTKVEFHLWMKPNDFDQLWVYNGLVWKKVTGAANQPQAVSSVVGRPSPTSILLLDKTANLWVYNGHSWKCISGGVGSPSVINNIYGRYPAATFMVIRDKNDALWLYNGYSWSQQSGGSNQPQKIDQVYDDPAPDSIVLKDNHSMLWVYNGYSWKKLTGGVGQPPSLETVGGYTRANSIVFKDGNSQLWIYDGHQFKQQTGVAHTSVHASDANKPPSIDKFFGHPTESSIVISDNDQHNLWVYDNYSWSMQTGGDHQPDAVNAMFMVRQKYLQ